MPSMGMASVSIRASAHSATGPCSLARRGFNDVHQMLSDEEIILGYEHPPATQILGAAHMKARTARAAIVTQNLELQPEHRPLDLRNASRVPIAVTCSR